MLAESHLALSEASSTFPPSTESSQGDTPVSIEPWLYLKLHQGQLSSELSGRPSCSLALGQLSSELSGWPLASSLACLKLERLVDQTKS